MHVPSEEDDGPPFAALRDLTVKEVAAAWGVPLALLRANIPDLSASDIRQLRPEAGALPLQSVEITLGPIPSEIGAIRTLKSLRAWGVQHRPPASLFPLPSELGHCATPLPSELGRCAALETLRVTGLLMGSVPPELGACAALKVLMLPNNRLTGRIPPELGACAALETVILEDNNLTGEIPSELGRISRLQRVQLANNELEGAIPSELGRCGALTVLRLHGNRLAGATLPGLETCDPY